MQLPFEPIVFGIRVNVHLILEYTAFIVAFRYYVYLRKHTSDPISKSNRLSIIIGAVFGAWLGSRLVGYLENPIIITTENFLQLLNTKTIMGGLFGGLLGVELAKKIIGEKQSSGDLFTLPIIVGIVIGRMGCFLAGINEFTYGRETQWFTGMNLGDGVLRHPIALYEILFLSGLFFLLRSILKKQTLPNGTIFQWFMISYFSFRFLLEFIKPTPFLPLGLSSIQWLCLLCLLYYHRTIRKTLFYAR